MERERSIQSSRNWLEVNVLTLAPQGSLRAGAAVQEPPGKIDGLVKQNLLAQPQADLLHEERYLGNAAVHEVERPSRKDVEDGLAIVEARSRTVRLLIRSNWRTVATGVFRGRRGCAGRMMDGWPAWLLYFPAVRNSANRSLRRATNSSTDSAGRPVISSTVAVTRSYRFSRCSRAMVARCSSTYAPSLAPASTCSAHVSHGTST